MKYIISYNLIDTDVYESGVSEYDSINLQDAINLLVSEKSTNSRLLKIKIVDILIEI